MVDWFRIRESNHIQNHRQCLLIFVHNVNANNLKIDCLQFSAFSRIDWWIWYRRIIITCHVVVISLFSLHLSFHLRHFSSILLSPWLIYVYISLLSCNMTVIFHNRMPLFRSQMLFPQIGFSWTLLLRWFSFFSPKKISNLAPV